MAQKRAMQLNLKNIEKAHKKITQQKEVEIENEFGVFKFKFDTIFRQTKLAEVTLHLAKRFREFYDVFNRNDEYTNNTLFSTYIHYLVIRYFTDIFTDDTFEDFATEVAQINKMIDLDLINPILDQLPKGELDKAYKTIAGFIQNWQGDYDLLNGLIEDLEQKIQSGEIENPDEIMELIPEGIKERMNIKQEEK